MTHRIVVLGAGYAGPAAAKGATRKLRRSNVRITLVDAIGHFVERVRLHQLAAGQPLEQLPLSGLLAGTHIELVVARVTAVDAATRTVRVDAAPYAIGYDTLVYALGSTADTAAVPGAATHASAVATYQDAVRLRERAADAKGSLVVAGAGLTGIETAAEPAETYPGLKVRLVTGGELAVDARGLLTVDPTLRSLSHPEVFAAGDAVAAYGPDGAASRMSCQTGLPMGAYVAGSVAASLTGRTPKPLRLRYVWQNISLGRHDGLTQFTRADDSPVAAVLTGRASARFKEAVTRGTVPALRR